MFFSVFSLRAVHHVHHVHQAMGARVVRKINNRPRADCFLRRRGATAHRPSNGSTGERCSTIEALTAAPVACGGLTPRTRVNAPLRVFPVGCYVLPRIHGRVDAKRASMGFSFRAGRPVEGGRARRVQNERTRRVRDNVVPPEKRRTECKTIPRTTENN